MSGEQARPAAAEGTAPPVAKGTELPEVSVRIQRADLVRYAGAAGDLNPIHWNERTAHAAGLPDVIAHGMLTMGMAVRVVTQWTGDPGSVTDYQVRFTRPVVVPDTEDGAEVTFGGTVASVHEDGTVTVSLRAHSEGQSVLGRSTAVVRLSAPR